MKPLLPGQCAVARHEGKVCLVACDHRENVPLGGVAFLICGGIHHVTINGVHVPAVNVNLRLTAGKQERYFVGWVDELAEGVIESLANQAELPIILASPFGERVGSSIIDNGIRAMMQKQLGIISALAERAPWTPHHFAAARAYIESQYPTAAALWERVTPSPPE